MKLKATITEQWEYRQDRGELLSASVVREDGTMLAEGFAARAGVMEYRLPSGKVLRELVTEEVLADYAGALARTPITLGHPDPAKYPDGVTPDNVSTLVVGDTDGEVAVLEGGFVKVRMAIRRRDALDAVRNGTHELSPGYNVIAKRESGTHPVYGRYDSVQVRRTSNNHLAIVEKARGGPAVRFRADTAITNTSGASPKGATVNPRFLQLLTLLGITSRIDSDDAAIDAAVGALGARSDAASASATKLATEQARADTEKARADKAEAELTVLRAAETARADAAAMAELQEVAKTLGVDTKTHTDSAALRRAIAAKHLGTDLRADASIDYIQALVDLAKHAGASRTDGLDTGRKAWTQPAETSTTPTAVVAIHRSPAELSRARADAAFKAARGDK